MSYLPPYTYCVAHGPYTALRYRLNDIPFYRITDTQKNTGVTETSTADHLLVPGENTFTFEIHEADEKYFATFDLQLNFDRASHVFEFGWPEVYRTVPAVMSTPLTYTLSFQMPDFTFRSAFLDAAPRSFGLAGDRELREAVRRFHDTLVRADPRSFLDEMRLKSDELQRAYPGTPLYTNEHLARVFEKRFSRGLEVQTLDMDDLLFESCADGRVAYVTRRDGGRPILALTPDGQGMHHDLWLTHHAGDWRVFR